MANVYKLDSSNNYSNPHDETYIYDNTTLEQSTTVNNGVVLLQPFFSSKGEDNTVVTLTSDTNAISNFGYPNVNLYGQAYYQAINWLKSGGIVKAVRLSASDATKSNIILMAKIVTKKVWKTDATGAGVYVHVDGTEDTIAGTDGTKVYVDTAEVEFILDSFVNIPKEKNNVKALLKTKMTSVTTTDANGNDMTTLEVPVFCIACNGKGAYGNDYRFRITPEPNRDKSTTYRNYTMDLSYYDETLGLNVITNGSLTSSLYTEAKNVARQSQYLEDLFNKQGYPLTLYSLDTAFDVMSNALLPIIQNQYASTTAKDIDVLYLLDSTQTLYDNVSVTGIDLSLASGFALVNGDDGNFKTSDPNREDNMNDMLINFFEGKVVTEVLDRRELKFAHLMDANFPLEVKVKMNELRDRRRDFVLWLDAGMLYNIGSLKSYLKDELSVAIERNFSIIVNTQNFDVYDVYCGRNIAVTANYLVARLLPNHILNKGSHVPFAGLTIPLDNYIIPNSLRPVLSSNEDKSEIYDLRGNYKIGRAHV